MPSDKNATDSPKWWIDETRPDRTPQPSASTAVVGQRFYRSAAGYDQETARSNLTDLNRKLLREANPPEGDFSTLNLNQEPSPEKILEQIKRQLPLPPGSRGVIVDSGKMVRVILTGTPPGERILEFNFNREAPTFDVWIGEEWLEEISFRSLRELSDRAPGLIAHYLGPDAFVPENLLV